MKLKGAIVKRADYNSATFDGYTLFVLICRVGLTSAVNQAILNELDIDKSAKRYCRINLLTKR